MMYTCANCSAPTRTATRFCSATECRRARDRARYVPTPKSSGACAECGGLFTGNANRVYCSKRCRRAVQNRKRAESGTLPHQMEKYREKRKAWQDANWRRYMLRRVCRTCSDEFTQDPRSRAMDRCTGCRRLDKMQVELWSPPAVTVIPGAFWHAGRCRVCDAAFVSQHADVTCSTVCRRLRQKPSLGSKDWISREDRRGVYVRDAFICQLCSEPVDQDADPLSNRYPSLDHIVPRSQGGDDALSNLQTAHRICNSRRRDMSVAEYRGRYLQAA